MVLQSLRRTLPTQNPEQGGVHSPLLEPLAFSRSCACLVHLFPDGAAEPPDRVQGHSPFSRCCHLSAPGKRDARLIPSPSPFGALEDELCFIYIKEAISEPICDQICCQRNFAYLHYIWYLLNFLSLDILLKFNVKFKMKWNLCCIISSGPEHSPFHLKNFWQLITMVAGRESQRKTCFCLPFVENTIIWRGSPWAQGHGGGRTRRDAPHPATPLVVPSPPDSPSLGLMTSGFSSLFRQGIPAQAHILVICALAGKGVENWFQSVSATHQRAS